MRLLFRTFYFWLLLIAGLSCKPTVEDKGFPAMVHPNVIIILSDDQGWGDLSYHGNTNLNTPNLDKLAAQGVSFTNFYVQPVCSPTRAELLTGRFFSRLGVYSTSAGGERFNLGETTIAEVFKAAGYATAAYGKWHSGSQAPYHPNARGFDDYYGFTSGHWGNYFAAVLERNGELVKGKGYLPDDLTDKGLEFIERNRHTPFFLFLPLNTPHSPMQVPDRYWEKFKDKQLSQRHKDSTLEDQNFTKAALAMVENIDYNVGRITTKVKEMSLDENTIIVYLSDNGPNSFRWNNGMRGRKGSVDEGGVRTPFFVKWKNVLPRGKTINSIAGSIDIMPTLISLTGIQARTNKPMDGLDLSPLMFKEETEKSYRFIYNHWNGKTSIRSQQYRLDDQNRLYDINADRGQVHDLSASQPAVLERLVHAKEQWLTEMEISPELPVQRTFPLGHPDFTNTLLPARDGEANGTIKRSNKYPNDSYFTNWTSANDYISWEVEVLEAGQYEVELYYTCAPENVGVIYTLSFENRSISIPITKAHDPPETGMENDRHPRIESYIKDFIPIELGTIELPKGSGELRLSAALPKHKNGIDVGRLIFRRRAP